MKKYTLEITVFLSGAVVMMLELVGSRVVAPYLGTSIIVWTSLIGIILGCLSFGYWWGGRLADKTPSARQLSLFIALAAGYIVIMNLTKQVFLSALVLSISNLYINTILAALVLFAVPSILLGTVSPYAVRLKIEGVATSGETVGNLYAISTVGSIVGTFLAGFILVAAIGTTSILYLLAIILLAVSLFLYSARDIRRLGLGATVLFFIISLAIYYGLIRPDKQRVSHDTLYSHITVVDGTYFDRRPVRYLLTNPGEAQSGMYLDNPEELVFDYSKMYRLAEHFNPNIKRALMLGGAGYSYPRAFLREHENATIDVVEIDPGMTRIAREYFGLTEDPRLATIHEDARTFLNQNTTEYDVIYGDAFKSFYALPYQLTTQEALARVSESLAPNGVFIVNIISAIEGKKSKFFQAEYATLRSVFPDVRVFAVADKNDPEKVQNVMLVAFKTKNTVPSISQDHEMQSYLDKEYTRPIATTLPVLTDDFAPVDNYIMAMAE